MSPGVFVVRDTGELVEMAERPYATEAVLQKLLEDYPSLLLAEDGSEGRSRYVLVKREAGLPAQEGGVGRWSVDHLFLDQEGVPTLVEVKRSSDSRIRREVVGQMLDYAANAVVYWPVEHLRATFEATCSENQRDPDEVLRPVLEEETDVEDFWLKVRTNLEARRIRLVFVADVIPPELRTIVEFLNEQMKSTEVLALEVKEYGSDGLKTLVSTVVGQTRAAQQAKGQREPSEKQRLYQEFWTEVIGEVKQRFPGWSRARTPPPQSWFELPAGRTGIFYSLSFVSDAQVRAELYVDPYDEALQGGEAYRRLEAHKTEIESAFGGPLQWEPLETRRASRIAAYRAGTIEQSQAWPEYKEWLVSTVGKLRGAIQPFVEKL